MNGYFSSYDEEDDDNSVLDAAEKVADMHFKKRSIKNAEPAFLHLQEEAFEKKDSLLYFYSTGVLFLIKNVDAIAGNDSFRVEELKEIVLDGPVKHIDAEVLTEIQTLCKQAKSQDYKDILIHKELSPELKEFTISDFLGRGITYCNLALFK